MTDSGAMLELTALGTWRERLRGLLGTGDDAGPVALCGCSSIHTVGMRYAIDVAFVTRGGEVLRSRRAVPPGRLVSAPGAFYAFERPTSQGPWPREGSWVSIARTGSADSRRSCMAIDER